MERTKYEITIEGLIDDFSEAITQCKAIIVLDVPKEISEDKLHNVLKGKRMAAEDAVYYAKQIDEFEKKLNGVEEEEVIEDTVEKQPLKKYTKK